VLRQRGPSTVREVQSRHEARPTGYTTVLKTLQIAERGLVRRDATRAHVYERSSRSIRPSGQIVGDLLARVFWTARLRPMHAPQPGKPAEELSQIRDILDEFERGR
jgi:hypothetical protein